MFIIVEIYVRFDLKTYYYCNRIHCFSTIGLLLISFLVDIMHDIFACVLNLKIKCETYQ